MGEIIGDSWGNPELNLKGKRAYHSRKGEKCVRACVYLHACIYICAEEKQPDIAGARNEKRGVEAE